MPLATSLPTSSPRLRRSFSGRLGRGLRAFLFLLVGLAGIGFAATRLISAKAERDYPPLGRWVEVDGLDQHILERGSGDPVVFVHGAFGALQDFAATILAPASERYRCVAWDRPGHGYSERSAEVNDPGVQARLLLALIEELKLERPLLVGFSYGGAVALAAAMEDPGAVGGVLLLNGPSHPWPDPLDLHYELPTIPVLGPLLTETMLTPVGALLSKSSVENAFAPLPITPSFEASPVALSLRPPSYRANAEDIRTLKPFLREQSAHYDRLRVPVRMLVSDTDGVVSPTIHAPALHAAAPMSTFVPIENAGHQILYTHPELVLQALDDAMAERLRE